MPKHRTSPAAKQLELILHTEKRCSKCRTVQSVDEFGVSRKMLDGLNGTCRTCRAKCNKLWYDRKRALFTSTNSGVSITEKRCPRCDLTKPAQSFGANRSRNDGLTLDCKECIRKRTAEHYIKNQDKVVERNKSWRKRNARRSSELTMRYKARRVDATTVVFTAAQLDAKCAYHANKCWLCSAPATAIDHVKPLAKGGAHMLCNLRPICQPCNSSKGAKWPFAPMTAKAA